MRPSKPANIEQFPEIAYIVTMNRHGYVKEGWLYQSEIARLYNNGEYLLYFNSEVDAVDYMARQEPIQKEKHF